MKKDGNFKVNLFVVSIVAYRYGFQYESGKVFLDMAWVRRRAPSGTTLLDIGLLFHGNGVGDSVT
jgi:hypothetical protein